jgi:hypothetical protein
VIVGSVLLIVVAVGLLVGGIVDGSNPLIIGSMATTVLAAIVLVIGVRQAADVDEDETPADNTPTQGFASPFRDGGRRSPWDRFRRGTVEAPPASGVEAGGDPARGPDGARTIDPARDAEAQPPPPRGPIPAQGGRDAPTSADPSDAPREPTTNHDDGQVTAVPRDGGPSGVDVGHAGDVVDGSDDDFDEVPADEPGEELVTEQQAAQVATLQNEVLVIDGRPRYHLSGCVHLLGRDAEPLPVAEARELGFGPCALCEPDATLLGEASQV